jgi:DivIVA domain-containing protein
MIDLTPLEVRKKKGDFKKALRGYEPVLVDDFLDLVADRLDQLVRENMAMTERLTRLENQVAENRERERALTDALVTAQEMREEVRQQTAREADLLRRTAEQESAQVRRSAEQHAAQTKHAAEQEAAQIRSDVLKMREREEDVLRRLRARQQQLLQSYRTVLAREMAELQVIGETLDIEELSPLDGPRTPPRDPAPKASPRATSARRSAAPAPRTPSMDETPVADAYLADTAIEDVAPIIAAAAIIEEFEALTDTAHTSEASAARDASDMPELPELPAFGAELGAHVHEDEDEEEDAAVDDSASMRMLDAPMEMDLQTDMLDHASIMGAIEVAILEDDEPFAPEPVDEWDDDVEDDQADVAYSDSDSTANAPEPEIGAPDHDATVLLENALRAGYRIDLEDDADGADDEEPGLELLLDDATDMDDEDGEPPRGWLDKMIDDEER